MTYRQLFKSFQDQLTGKYDSGEIESMFFLALEHFLGWKKMDFIMKESEEADAKKLQKFENLIAKLKCFTPIQYVLGEAWFYDHNYIVNEHVLIPRSETEELIELIKKMKPEANSILDIGTGSGCIAIELALYYKTKVFAMDISEKAIAVASENADKLGAVITFLRNNILDLELSLNNKFNIIVSNPPYVMESEKVAMSANVVDFEPDGALYVSDENPLLFYKAIHDFALKHAEKDALIALEINEQLGEQTAELFLTEFSNVIVHKDIHGKDRFITAIYNGE
jgi:release factor glutamine methyltransferase